MMARTCLSLFATLLAICAAAAVHAQSTIVIGNFEGLPNNTLDPEGWVQQSSSVAASFNSPPAPAGVATSGTGAMSLVTKGFWAVRLDNGARPTLGADLLSHPILKFDVSIVPSQWTDATAADNTDNWARIAEKISINDNTGWQEVLLMAAGDPASPGFPGGFNIDPAASGVQTRTLTLDTRTDAGGNPMNIDATGFVQLWISANMSSASFPNGGRFWIDNIRLVAVPEPATAGLACVAGLFIAAVRRRRAA
jgi:hypothetical protein